MQTLLDVVQEFTTWCCMEINVQKTFLLVIDKDRKRRESMPAPNLRINKERRKTLDINDACWYLSYWGTGNDAMSATREVVCENARVARDLIKSHPLTQELFAQNESVPSCFRQPSSNGRRVSWRVCKKSEYKSVKTHCTYHGQPQSLYTPSQLQRVAMSAPCRQEYSRRPCCSMLTNACGMKMSSKKIMPAQLAHTLTEWQCNSFTDWIDEKELWDWNVANIQRSEVSCRLCKKAREQRGASTQNLPEETYGHINIAFCDGMATTVTAAHHFIWRHLHASIQAAQTPTCKLRFVTPDKESSM